MKTLIGKDNYLFLINDSSKSIEKHTNLNENLNDSILKTTYDKFKNNMLFIVVPDKEITCKQYLPSDVKCEYRNELECYRKYFGENLIDADEVLEPTDFYKTDTHTNQKGGIKLFILLISYLQDKFNVQLNIDTSYEVSTVTSLSSLNIGLGDMTWENNRGSLKLDNIEDTYYNINDFELVIWAKYDTLSEPYSILTYDLMDISNSVEIVTWEVLSKNILFKKNKDYTIKKKVVIFYDSYLTHTLNLYKNIFEEVYLIKSIFKKDLINKIKPDFIIEIRAERFMSYWL